MLERIIDLLNDKTSDIFYEIQTEYGIECGDCEPLDEYEFQKRLEYLAEHMKAILEKQLG